MADYSLETWAQGGTVMEQSPQALSSNTILYRAYAPTAAQPRGCPCDCAGGGWRVWAARRSGGPWGQPNRIARAEGQSEKRRRKAAGGDKGPQEQPKGTGERAGYQWLQSLPS